ncbi:hypothetical protein HMPREF0083_05667 [Aneurinibacillus aneurinilyticus ATCC 12856]|uniref:Uncharacterized protein n=1 Tax=Aneurinibacillus aneurinilyticus ATCC 12856 TaxID=649747 RepID=U1WS19_ANEAE|nr:hypothetical protein HMPREF0083_05667 [Aneurinibacillus aneurinilyticus ATCC 12856]
MYMEKILEKCPPRILYTSDLISRHIFVVGSKEKARWLFFCRSAGYSQPPLFSEFPPSNHATLLKYQM